MLSITVRLTLLLFCTTVSIRLDQVLAEEVSVTYPDLNHIFSIHHPFWPPWTTPPPSNITGLNLDDCYGTADCAAPRVCGNCFSLPCFCLSPKGDSCLSTSDCDFGEFCTWSPDLSLTSGRCRSMRVFEDFEAPILREPIDSLPPLLGLGLTGDRCFSTSDCRGQRHCVGDPTVFGHRFQKVSPCRGSYYPCICTPAKFVECSSSSDCLSSDEICATVIFQKENTYSYIEDFPEIAMLTPLCISTTLLEHETIIPISSLSLTYEESVLPIARIQHPVSVDPSELQPFLNISPDSPPFSVSSVSAFNSFTTNDLANEFIGGILSFIMVAQLHRILRGLIYFIPGIHHHGYSSYILFSRLVSFRNVFRLFKRREPFATRRRRNQEHEESIGFSLKIVLFPILALTLLYVAELVTIISGTQVRSEFFAEQNFDPRLSIVRGARRPRREDDVRRDCDDFFVPTRGLFESGKVLKCVSVSGDYLSEVTESISLFVEYYSGKTYFELSSRNRSAVIVDLFTSIRSKSGVNMRTMPFRLDLLSEQARNHLLNGIVNGVRHRLGYNELDPRHTLWAGSKFFGSRGIVDSMTFVHYHGWNDSAETIKTAFMAELRDMDLVLNSTGKPWVFTRPYTFEQMNPSMVVVKQHRIASGWLLIAAVLVTAIQFVVNTRLTHFDEVAFVAMKELMGEDCVLGPLASDRVSGTEVDLRERDETLSQEA